MRLSAPPASQVVALWHSDVVALVLDAQPSPVHSASETAAVPGPSLWPQVAQCSGVQSIQSAADALPGSEYLPAAQSMQSVAEVLAAPQRTVEHLPANRPAAQSVHATVDAVENCPAAQGVHVDAPG